MDHVFATATLMAKYRYAIEPALLLLSVYLVAVLWNELRRGSPRKA